MITEAINLAIHGKDLEYDLAKSAMGEIMEGNATAAQIAAFLTAMRMKGENIVEITACAAAMREKAMKIDTTGQVMDIVGTGGDGAGTFNISTTTAFVVAAGGVVVAKHGNRGVSGKSGAADVLEALGANIQTDAKRSEEILRSIGVCFLFAPIYHNSMKYAAPVRKELGVRTIFNILGPLVNPAGANTQLMGVYDENLVVPLANVMNNLGIQRGMVLHGKDGLDEATVTEETIIAEVRHGEVHSGTLSPEQFGLSRGSKSDLLGGDATINGMIAKDILSGKLVGPKRDVVLLNAGVALYLAGKGNSIDEGIRLAERAIDSGAALQTLERFIALTNEVRG